MHLVYSMLTSKSLPWITSIIHRWHAYIVVVVWKRRFKHVNEDRRISIWIQIYYSIFQYKMQIIGLFWVLFPWQLFHFRVIFTLIEYLSALIRRSNALSSDRDAGPVVKACSHTIRVNGPVSCQPELAVGLTGTAAVIMAKVSSDVSTVLKSGAGIQDASTGAFFCV